MSDIFVMSFDGSSSPSMQLKLRSNEDDGFRGWGFGWYPNNNKAAIVTKDPVNRDLFVDTESFADRTNFCSTVFLCKVKVNTRGYTHYETQPFSRSFAGRDWLFMHNGDLDKSKLNELHVNKSHFLEPLGTTDSEIAFCYLLDKIHNYNARKLSEIPPEVLHEWFMTLDPLGSADSILTDGLTIACFRGTMSRKEIYYTRRLPIDENKELESDVASLRLNAPGDAYRTALIFASTPFTEGNWKKINPCQLILARRGAITWNGKPTLIRTGLSQPQQQDLPQIIEKTPFANTQLEQAQTQTAQVLTNFPKTDNKNIVYPMSQQLIPPLAIAKPHIIKASELQYRIFDITHITNYEYSAPVEYSTHVFRLHPVEDRLQTLLNYELNISCDGEEIGYEDVFGNQSVHYTISSPYTKLNIQSKTRIKLYQYPIDDFSLTKRQNSIPLMWMPWQRQMMMPYLLPVELPETQLVELTEYAMSFVDRNDFHLLNTLEDINNTIYNDYQYVQGATSLATTPFEVYANRKGVCQDFANLFICMAQLLGVPSRYRMGYIYTGANYTNKIQSEASHAWVEVYMPYVGWRGFDPTNGCLVEKDHIRVACGRNYRDATPTSGTIFKGGGIETLNVDVKMTEVQI